MKQGEISLIHGGLHTDERGTVSFINDFDMAPVRRFYIIEHPDTKTVRDWQGHKREQKWFLVIAGSFKVVLVQPDDWDHPSQELATDQFMLKSSFSAGFSFPLLNELTITDIRK